MLDRSVANESLDSSSICVLKHQRHDQELQRKVGAAHWDLIDQESLLLLEEIPYPPFDRPHQELQSVSDQVALHCD